MGREVLEWKGMDRPRCGVWVPGPHPSFSQSRVLVIACHRHVSLSLLFIVGGAGALAAIHWWWAGHHLPYAGSGVGPCSLLVVWGPHRRSSVVVVGIPFHEGGGWLHWRVLVTHGCSLMVVWWVLKIVVVVLHVVEGGGHSSPIIVKGGGDGRLLPIVVEGGGATAAGWLSWAVIVVVG